MEQLMTAVFNLALAMAKEIAANNAGSTKSIPPLLEDEIAEILDKHKGEEILILFHTNGALRYRYYNYDLDKNVVFTIYDALENSYTVTVNGTNILDL